MTLPVRDFIIQRLLEFDPNFDVGSGVPTTSLMIDPQAIILQPIVDELTVVQASQSILTILESDDPDAFPEDIVDGLASNAFVERNAGAIGSDVERLRFFQPQDYSSRKGVLIFRGPTGQRYTNSEAVSVTSAEMALNQEGTLYFIDVPIIALEEGAAFNVDAGGITSMEAEPAGVANVTNLFGIDQGRNRETNTELIDRIKVAVTVRALVTGRGIVVTLTENFTTIEEIEPLGFGAPEMMRDIVYNVHIGGNVDVYIKTAAFSDGSKDVFGIEIDTTRQAKSSATVSLLVQGVGYSLGHTSIDRTNGPPTVETIDGLAAFTEGVQYSINDSTGLITREAAPGIFHITGVAANVVSAKVLQKVSAFADVRSGMILTIDVPATVAGTYTVKEKIDDDNIEIYGSFATSPVAGVDFAVDDNLVVSYEYNPASIDIVKEPRSAPRADHTITDVPVMYIASIEVLDPLSGEPTGDTLSGDSGFGTGGFGDGPYGVGLGGDWMFIVAKPTLRHSWLEDNYIEFTDLYLGASVRVNYKYASAIPPIQAFMDDRNNQSETASLLARHFIPAFVDATTPLIYGIPSAAEATAITVDEMTKLVTKFIDDIDAGQPLEISDLVDVLYDNGASRVDLNTMNSLHAEIHNHDGSVVFASPDDAGLIAVPDDEIPDPTDKPLSPRNARFRARNIVLQRTLV